MNAQQESLLKKYAEAVLSAPAYFHLTSDRDASLFWNRHIEDGIKLHDLIPAEYHNRSLEVVDVGSGNGIPGIPFSILEPNWSVSLLDSDTKKCGFIESFCKSNAIDNVKVSMGRAETFAKGEMRSSYYIGVGRALGKLPVAIELISAFVRVGGLVIVPHGTTAASELEKSARAIELMGLENPTVIPYVINSIHFSMLIFKKIKDTPLSYPRSVGIPTKRPL